MAQEERMGKQAAAYQGMCFFALMVLFGVLNYAGSALYFATAGITTVKPFSGIALALLLINGRKWLWPILISGTAGAIIAKAMMGIEPAVVTVPFITSGALFLVYYLCQSWIGQKPDFRAWKQLLFFIAIAVGVSILSSFAFALGREALERTSAFQQLVGLDHSHHIVLCDLHAGHGAFGHRG
jgi:hypothetical protein